MELAISDQLHIQVRLDEGSLWATIDELPGVFATGDNLEELRKSLEEGVSLYLAEPGEPAVPVHLRFDGPVQATASAVMANA